jgi:hypothetical protein
MKSFWNFTFWIFLAVLGLELRAFCLLDKYCSTWAMFSTLFALLYFLDTLSLFALDHDPPPYAFHVAGITDVSHRLSKSRVFLSLNVSDVSSWFCSEFPHWQEYYRRDPVFFWLCPVNNYPTFEDIFSASWFMGVSASCVHYTVTLCPFIINSYSDRCNTKTV